MTILLLQKVFDYLSNIFFSETFDDAVLIESGGRIHQNNDSIVFKFKLPYYGTFGIIPPPLMYWIQMGILIMTASLVNACLGIVIYQFIVKKRKQQQQQQQQQQQKTSSSSSSTTTTTTTTSFITTFGFVIPIALWTPLSLVRILTIRNASLMLTLGALPTFVVFRSLEAYFGTTPQYAEQNIWSYITYIASPIQFKFDELHTQTLVKTTINKNINKFYRFTISFLNSTIAFSILHAYSYQLFPPITIIQQNNITTTSTSHVVNILYYNFGNMFRKLLNNYALSYLFAIYLESGMFVSGLFMSLSSRYETMELHNKPIQSTSISDFWGKRWNIQVGGLLKRAIYLPMLRNNNSKHISIMGTFVASGLLHEYVIALIRFNRQLINNNNGSSSDSSNIVDNRELQYHGYHMIFFIYNGIILIIEQIVIKHLNDYQNNNNINNNNQKRMTETIKQDNSKVKDDNNYRSSSKSVTTNKVSSLLIISSFIIPFRKIQQFPNWVKSIFVTFAIVPVAHLFLDQYVLSGVLADFSVAFPKIVKL